MRTRVLGGVGKCHGGYVYLEHYGMATGPPPTNAYLEVCIRRTLRYVQRPDRHKYIHKYIYRKIVPVARLGWLAPARQ